MSVTVFVQEHSGDYNLVIAVENRATAMDIANIIREDGGYWLGASLRIIPAYESKLCNRRVEWNEDGTTFVPWHRIDFIKIEESK